MRAFMKILTVSVTMALGISANRAIASMDPSADFSIINNPSDEWSYGYFNQPFPGGSFLPDTIGTPGPVDVWSSAFGTAGVQHNGTGAIQTIPDGVSAARYLPGELGLAPGPNAQLGTLQYTAPVGVPALYTLNLVLEGLDVSGATNSKVYILDNGIPVTSTNVTGFGIPFPLSATVVLNPGDTLDVADAWGTGGAFGNYVGFQSFQLSAAVIPEPGSLSLLAVGGFSLLKRRRSRA